MPRSYSDYSDDESVDIHVRHVAAGHGAPPVRRGHQQPHYIQTVRERERDVFREQPRPYYQAGPIMLQPERTTIVRTRSRSRERRSTPPSQAPAPPPPTVAGPPAPVAPVVIHNKIINEQSDSDDYSDDSHYHRRHRSHSHVHSLSRNSSQHSFIDDARDKWELEQTRRELEQLKMANAKARDVERMDRQYREEHELQQAKRELDDIKRREKLEHEEKRIRREIELKKLEEERRAAEEKDRRDREAKEAIEHYKLKEAERIAKEKKEKELAEKEYRRRLQEDLIRSGVDEKAIEAIMKKEKIKHEKQKPQMPPMMMPPPPPPGPPQQVARPTYTRMSLRHLDIETLIFHKIDFEYDEQPGYVIIKRWVPEWEQDMLWEHTRRIRIVEKKEEKVVLAIEGKHHHGHKDDNFEWVRKKERRRSKSPGLLMYLAGGRPA